MAYDYREAVKADVKQWIEENGIPEDLGIYDNAEEYLYDTLWDVSEVTGNGNYDGCSSYADFHEGVDYKAFVKGNLNLAWEALREFGYPEWHYFEKVDNEEWEDLDVTIRCYLLSEAVAEALKG